MRQKSRKTSRQRSAVNKSEEGFFGTEFYDSSYFRKEFFLSYKHWNNIEENRRPWYDYNHNVQDRKKTAAAQQIIIPCINEIITTKLTDRQREVVTLYFLSNHTQLYIARKLGISQPTVSQHLNGKKRNGKKIGGSVRKIRKIIHHISSAGKEDRSNSQVIHILDQLLDERITLRKSHNLIRSMLK